MRITSLKRATEWKFILWFYPQFLYINHAACVLVAVTNLKMYIQQLSKVLWPGDDFSGESEDFGIEIFN